MDQCLTCGICFELFSDSRIPLILVCGHTFCSACLSSIITQRGKIICPCDRSSDSRSLQNINKNISLINLVDYFHNKNKRPKCKFHISKSIQFICTNCKEEFCSRCLISHNFHRWIDIKNYNDVQEYINNKILEINNYQEEIKKILEYYHKSNSSLYMFELNACLKIKEKISEFKKQIEYLEQESLQKIQLACKIIQNNIFNNITPLNEILQNTLVNHDQLDILLKKNLIQGIFHLEKISSECLEAKNQVNHMHLFQKLLLNFKNFFINI